MCVLGSEAKEEEEALLWNLLNVAFLVYLSTAVLKLNLASMVL
jgi:hypothetical protein